MASRRHRRGHKRSGHSKKNMLNKMVATSMTTVKSTSKKYMPKVKSGLESVGSKVVSTGQKSVPFFKRMTQKLFSVFSSKSRRRRH